MSENMSIDVLKKKKLRGLSPRANYVLQLQKEKPYFAKFSGPKGHSSCCFVGKMK